MRERTASCRFIPASSIWSKPAIRNPSNLEAPICVLISQKVKCVKFATRDTGCTIKISLLHSISILSISPTMAGSTSSPWLKNTTWMNTPSSESSVIISKTLPSEFIQSVIPSGSEMRLKRFHSFLYFLSFPSVKV